MTGTDIVPSDLESLERVAKIASASGLYGRESKEGVAVRIMLGMEMGFSPMQSLSGIHIVDGKPSLGVHLIASAIKTSSHYDYRILVRSDERCEIEFRERQNPGMLLDRDVPIAWEVLGVATFTIEDAKRAGLTGKTNWKNYPANMLYARAMSSGGRMFCPDVFGGAIYAEDEIEARPERQRRTLTPEEPTVAPEADEPIEGEVVPDETPETPAPAPDGPETIIDADVDPEAHAEAHHNDPPHVPLGTAKPEDDLGYGSGDDQGPVEKDPAEAKPKTRRTKKAEQPTTAEDPFPAEGEDVPDETTRLERAEVIKATIATFDKAALAAIVEGAGRPAGWKYGDYANWLLEQNDYDLERTLTMIGERADEHEKTVA